MVTAMVIYGTISLFVRNIPLSSAEVALFRAVIALAALLIFKRLRGKRLNIQAMGGDLPLLALSGAAMGFNWIFLFEAYRYTTVSVATLSYYFAPVLVMLACPVLFHERFTRLQAACFAGATLGLCLVISPGGIGADGAHLKGVAFGLAAAVLYASVVLVNKRIARVSGLDRTLWQFAAAALVLAPYVLFTTGIHLEGMTPPGWASLLTVGVIHSGVAYVLYFSSLSRLPGQESAILSYIDPLVAVVVSVAVFAESASLQQILGGALILACTLLNELAGNVGAASSES